MVQLISNFTCFLLISAKNFNLDLLLLTLDMADTTGLGAFLWESQPSGVGSGTEKIVFYYVSILMMLLPLKFFRKENSVAEEKENSSIGEVFLHQWNTVNFVGLIVRSYLMGNYSSKIVSSLLLAKNIIHCFLAVSKCLHFFSNTVTSRLFTHIVSTEKIRKDVRDRKYKRGINYTYYISCF